MRLCLSDFKLWIRLWTLCLKVPATAHCPQPIPYVPLPRFGVAWKLVLRCVSFHSPLSARPSRVPRGPVQPAGSSSGPLHFVPGSLQPHALQCLTLLYYLDLCLWRRRALIVLSRSALFPPTLPSLLVGHFSFLCLRLVCFYSWHVKPVRVERPCLPCYCHTVESGSLF